MEAKKKRKKEKQLQKYVTNVINFTLHFLAKQIGSENVQSNNSTSKEKIQEKKMTTNDLFFISKNIIARKQILQVANMRCDARPIFILYPQPNRSI